MGKFQKKTLATEAATPASGSAKSKKPASESAKTSKPFAAPAVPQKKSVLFRDAIGTLGLQATVPSIIEWVKEKHGVELGESVVNQYRSLERRKAGVSRKRRKPGRPAGVASSSSGSMSKSPKSVSVQGGDILGFMQDVKSWEGKLGKATIQKVVGVLYS